MATAEAENVLLAYQSKIRDAWYLKLCAFMLGQIKAEAILAEAEGRPAESVRASDFGHKGIPGGLTQAC